VIERHFYRDGRVEGVSPTAVRHLRAIVELCTRKGIRVVLVASPVHPRYYERIPAPFRRGFEELAQEFRASGVEVWDYSRFPMDDREFRNADHPNAVGAERFSRLVADRLRAGGR
jgi:hypothetical protein